MADDIRVNVLGPVELIVDGQRVGLGNSPILTKLLALLALGPDAGLPALRLVSLVWGDRPVSDATGSLQQAMRRLRKMGLGDRLPPERDGQYRLDLPADQVDARSLRATAAALDSDTPPSDAELDAALALWRGDPAADAGIHVSFVAQALAARDRLQAERRRRNKPRVLILDDKVGEKIANLLGDYACTVLVTIEDFWPLADRCDELFDAALVDLHLCDEDVGAEGLAVVDALRQRSSVPTVLMSYRPQQGPVDGLIQRYNLYDFFVKGGNSPKADFTRLRELVAEMLSTEAGELLVRRLDQDLVRCEHRAALRIRRQGGGDIATRNMQQDADAVRSVIRTDGTLTSARAAMASFNRKWLLEDA